MSQGRLTATHAREIHTITRLLLRAIQNHKHHVQAAEQSHTSFIH